MSRIYPSAAIYLCALLGVSSASQPTEPDSAEPQYSSNSPGWESFGITQVDTLFSDRPQLRAAISKGDPVYQWLVHAFAAPELSYRIAWRNAPSDHDIQSYSQSSAYPVLGGPSYIRVDGTYDKGIRDGTQPRPADEIMADLVFELHNARNGEENAKLDRAAIFQTISRDDYIKAEARIEFNAETETGTFYTTTWLPYCIAHAIPNRQGRWNHHHDDDFETYLRKLPPSSWYPWKFYGDRFDEYAALQGKESLTKAESGNMVAAQEVGDLYLRTRDFPDALSWFLKAAAGKNARALGRLGWMYSWGVGAPKDPDKGYEWYLQSAQLGDASSQEYVGSWLFNKSDYAAAATWYLKSAQQGNLQAEKETAWMYEHGRGVVADEKEAFTWILRAAQQGDLTGMRLVAARYEKGRGVVADAAEAKLWRDKIARASSSPKTP